MKKLDAQSFLSAIWPSSLLKNETLELRAIHKDKSVKRKFVRSIDEFISEAKKLGSDWNIYFGIATRREFGGKKQDCVRVGCVWVDFDRVDKLPDFENNQPSIIVNSGSGYHCYWLLEKPIYLRDGRYQEIESVNRALAKKFKGDENCIDITRILRVPGFLNYKYTPPREVIANENVHSARV